MCVLSYRFRVDVNSWVERGGEIIHWWSIGLDVSLFLIVGAATGNYLQLHYHFHFHFHFQSQFILGQLLGTIYNYIIISITIFNLNLNLFLDILIELVNSKICKCYMLMLSFMYFRILTIFTTFQWISCSKCRNVSKPI